MRDNLIHCVHLKRELELLLGFDSLPSMWRCVVYVCLCYVLVLFVSGGWYSNCNDTQSLITRQGFCKSQTYYLLYVKQTSGYLLVAILYMDDLIILASNVTQLE